MSILPPNSSDWITAPPVACFRGKGQVFDIRPFEIDTTLGDACLEGLAALLPILGCGEEAAALAFDALAISVENDPAGRSALAAIAEDESHHDRLIARLRTALPAPPDQREVLRIARRFHIDLGRGSVAIRLARIAALDSAVCLVLGRLLHHDGALGSAPAVNGALSAIWRDEARHVAVSRKLAVARADGATLRPLATHAREALSEILLLAGAALENLKVDPVLLARDVRRLPAGLLG